MINKQGKIWGSTTEIFNKNNVSIHRIEVKEGAYCSLHLHNHKNNIFMVEQGLLKVIIHRKDAGSDIVDETELGPGDTMNVEHGLLHKFEALEDTIAFEIYYVELTDDIVRRNVGGIKNG